ncbi:MAG: hydroxymethylglutaryl-CoA reductase, degradative [Bacteriovoracaceae bacterium]|jgi:hydroxymethylglutaryl-CoA reductase|nr:hydroxymethylglutaryl-CoA reductase, degradative [Halobacteriovoraceae bacterium]MDP7321403.1 hydroxymethylglutaryl-CoA reductase, degradative [Bacteriovoracaceae bacterium]
MDRVNGFSKLSKDEKIDWLELQLKKFGTSSVVDVKKFWHKDENLQKIFDDFSENTISNFYFPYGLAPNFKINEKIYTVPLVIEESSVVAAASKSAKFWLSRGGFQARILSTTKKGQVHFSWKGPKEKLFNFFSVIKSELLFSVKDIVANMESRGGGIQDVQLIDKTDKLEHYYQIDVKFETCDAMGANFINSVLESFGENLKRLALSHEAFLDSEKEIEVIMCILSNYTPECLVNVVLECPIEELGEFSGKMSPLEFAQKFERAVKIAKVDVNRAVTHNKGIFNGIDALILATGNDFRAIEACGHAYAAKDGQYRGLSSCSLKNGRFRFEMTLPLALGTVGGLTKLHPLAKVSLDILGRPSARELMMIVASVGLAQNFGALRSLITTGIQKGHMKMHLLNILNQLDATEQQVEFAKDYFQDKTVSFSSVRELIEKDQPFQ